jgi:hypothetical protein
MSNSPNNREQSQKIELTPTQQNPGAARPESFIIEDRDGGQNAPVRNEVPHTRYFNE